MQTAASFLGTFTGMNAKRIFILLMAVATVVNAGAQTKTAGIKAKGFFVVPMPGTIPVDQNGNPMKLNRDTVFYVYAESAGRSLQWERAWHGDRSFTLIPNPVKEGKADVGEAKSNGRKIQIIPAKGATLTQLELADDEKRTKPPQRIKPNYALLKYRWNKKAYYVLVGPLTELQSPLYQ